MAAWTAFVLQTKRKRNETEGSEEAGKRERRSRRPRSKRKKRETGRESRREEGEQGSGRGDFLLYPDRKTDWGAREGSPPFLHALCKDPGLPDITKSSKTKARVPTPPPHQSSQRGLLQMGIKPGGGEIMSPNQLAPAQGTAT